MNHSSKHFSRFSVEELRVSIGKGTHFELLEEFTYTTSVTSPLEGPSSSSATLYIRPFGTDFASIPVLVQLRFDKYGKHNLPAVVHDYLLQHRGEYPWLSRRSIDKIFREAMQDQGVNRFDCAWMYAGVRFKSFLKEGREGYYYGDS